MLFLIFFDFSILYLNDNLVICDGETYVDGVACEVIFMSIHLKLVLTTFIWGLTPTLGKILSSHGAPIVVTFWRFIFAFLLLCVVLKAQKISRRLTFSDVVALTSLGITGIFLHNALMYKGLQFTGAAITSLIYALIIVKVAVIDSIFSRRLPSKTVFFGIFFSLIGIVIITFETQSDLTLKEVKLGKGELLIFGSSLSWAIYTVLSRPILTKLLPIEVITYASFFGLCLMLPFVFADMNSSIMILTDLKSLTLIIFLGFLSTALAFMWHQQAVKELGPITTTLYLNLMPIFGVISAVFFLDETITVYFVLGAMLVMFGILIVNIKFYR